METLRIYIFCIVRYISYAFEMPSGFGFIWSPSDGGVVMGNVITIDGPSGAGKSTVGRILAKKIGYCCLDTGAMYRAVALVAKRQGVAFDDGRALQDICGCLKLRFVARDGTEKLFLGEEDISDLIRNREFDMLSSKVSSVKEVRDSMKSLQRKMSLHEDLVAEGRDMGTVVFPLAKAKFFLTASLDARALETIRGKSKEGRTGAYR